MKKQWIAVLALLGFSAACICVSQASQFKEDPAAMTEDNFSELTNEELSVLTSVSVNEEKVRSGHLKEWQKQLLKEMRTLKSVLSEKYPSYDFTILECTGTGTSEGFSSFLFTEASHEGLLFDASCRPAEDPAGSMEVKDNFYRVFLEEPLKKLLTETLENRGLKVSEIRCSYTSVLGKEADETITLETVVQKDLPVQPTIQISFDGTDLDKESAGQLNGQASEEIRSLKIPGFYVLHVDRESEELARTSFAVTSESR